MSDATIFVQIASYRDPQLLPTIESLIGNADDPAALHFGLCWQHDERDEPLELFTAAGFTLRDCRPGGPDDAFVVLELARDGVAITALDVHHHDSRGACWARHALQQFYAGERYTLQLDSHHRVVPGWDRKLIAMLEGLRGESPKPLLTAYLPSFDPDDDPAARVDQAWQMNFDRFIPEGAVFFLPGEIPDWRNRTTPLRARFYSAHFAFADGRFAQEVQHDPAYFFHGEEISIAARAFTHGYDLYHPHQPVAWHEYTRKHRVKVWDDHGGDQRDAGLVHTDWMERNDLSHRRNRILFGMDGEDPDTIDFGPYGFGSERTLAEYERYSGLSFSRRSVRPEVLACEEPRPPAPGSEPDADWYAGLRRSNDIHVAIHRDELAQACGGRIPEDVDFAYLGAHDAEGRELTRQDLDAEAFAAHLADGDWIDQRLIFCSDATPVSYTLWPHGREGGWYGKIDRPWPPQP